MDGNCKDETLVSATDNSDKKCGARAKTTGKPCKRIPLPNGRCKFHGGRCTGPKTKQGKKNSSQNNLKDGRFTDAKVRSRAEYVRFLRTVQECNKLLKSFLRRK